MVLLTAFNIFIFASLFTYSICLTPIVIVPGIGGSQIQAKLEKNATKYYWCYKRYENWFTLWLNIEELIPWFSECWVDNLKLVPSPTSGKMENTPGVYTRNPGFGGTSGIEWLDPASHVAGVYFYPLIDTLHRLLGYTRGKDLRSAPYDFRYDPESAGDYFVRLKALIEDTYHLNGNKKVMLLSHSMGTPYSLYFLNNQTQDWKDTYLKAWTTISGVYTGAVKAILAYISGDGFGIPSVLDNPKILRKFQRTFSSLAFILPDREFWKHDEVLVKTANRSYTVNDYDDLFEDMGYPLAQKILRAVPRAWSDQPPNIKMFCFHGNSVKTPGVLRYPDGNFPDNAPDIDYVGGDGTVTTRSLKACLKWQDKQKQPIVHEEFSDGEHNAILGDARLIRAVVQALRSAD